MRRSFEWSDLTAIQSLPKKAEEKAEKRSSEIDGRILGWTISALGDGDSLEKFFEAIPGFFGSELVKDIRKHLPFNPLRNAFLSRTLSSKSITNSAKLHRLDIFMNTINLIGEDSVDVSSILEAVLFKCWDIAPQTTEVAHTLARWCASGNQRTALYARCTVTRILATVRERDDHGVEFATRITGLPERDLRDIAQKGIARTRNNLLLANLIHLCRQANHSDEWKLVEAFTEFDIRHTLPRLQNDFCALWNEFVDKARICGDPQSNPVLILNLIRHLYVILHRDSDAAPTAFSAADSVDFTLVLHPSEYPQCNIADHRDHPDSTAHVPVPTSRAFPLLNQPGDSPHSLTHRSTSDGITILRQVKQEGINNNRRPRSLSAPTTPGEIAQCSHGAPTATSPALPAHTSSYPTHASLLGVAATLQDIPPAATLSHLPEGASQQDLVAPLEESDIGEILSTASTPATLVPARVREPTLPIPNESLASSNVCATPTAKPLLPQPASSHVGFSISASPPSHHPNAEPHSILSGTEPSRLTGNATLPRLRVRGLVNTGSMCFANAVFQLLVRSPRFWDLFKELGDLKGQRGKGGPEIGGATPLMVATVKFFKEFMLKEEPPPTQQEPQHSAERSPSKDEGAKKVPNVVDSFEPIYMYDAMKEKKQLERLLNGQQQDAEEFFRLYLEALDEELSALPAFLSGPKSALGVEERELSQSGQTVLGKRGFTAESVESPLMRIFGGKFRSTLRAPNQLDTVNIEEWRSLQLDIQNDSVHTIEDALASISHQQPVQLGPSSSSEASQQVLVEGLPPVLVVHLKRFLYDMAADGVVKINKPVQFSPELEIPLEIMAPISWKFMEPAQYKLYGVIYHHGESASSGHYTVDLLHQNEGGGSVESWMHIDDDVVTAVRHEDVFRGHDNEWVDDRCAYMLFYCRTARAEVR